MLLLMAATRMPVTALSGCETEHTRRCLRLMVGRRLRNRLVNRKGNSNSRRSTLKIMRPMTTLRLTNVWLLPKTSENKRSPY